MINWKDVQQLHVVLRLSEILNRWYGVEVFFIDSDGQIQSAHTKKDSLLKNALMEMQMGLEDGVAYLTQDFEMIGKDNNQSCIFDSSLNPLKGIFSPLIFNDESMGGIFAYPFLLSGTTEKEKESLLKLLVEKGLNKRVLKESIEQLSVLTSSKVKYLRELTDFISGEIVEFYEKMSEREDRISELSNELNNKYRYANMIGKSKEMQVVYNLIQKIFSFRCIYSYSR